jgi:hypothetical protein
MILHAPLGDPPPGFWQYLAATWRQNLVLALLGGLGAGIAWWTDSHRLVHSIFVTLGSVGVTQLAMGGCIVLWRSHRFRGADLPR